MRATTLRSVCRVCLCACVSVLLGVLLPREGGHARAQEAVSSVNLAAGPEADCAAEARDLVRQYAPRWQTLIELPETQAVFGRSLECRLPDRSASTGIHEAVHVATHWGPDAVSFWVNDARIRVAQPALVPRGVIAERAARELPAQALYVRLYVQEQAQFPLFGLLDELNAYTSELDAAVGMFPLINSIFVNRSVREGLLTVYAFVAMYLDQLTDPTQVAEVRDPTLRAQVELSASTLRQSSEALAFMGALFARARLASVASCAVELWSQRRLGYDDLAPATVLRAHTGGVCAFFPGECAPLREALTAGFGCEHLRVTTPAPRRPRR